MEVQAPDLQLQQRSLGEVPQDYREWKHQQRTEDERVLLQARNRRRRKGPHGADQNASISRTEATSRRGMDLDQLAFAAVTTRTPRTLVVRTD